ncbi:KpsF/GutQ family sugar-phosphate isomerase [Hellea sp.]|nr:KpsF/GutQ family sugar-phosphate isomerase [Hellea sp.]
MNQTAIDVLKKEQAGLTALIAAMGDHSEHGFGAAFDLALQAIQAIQGRVIVSGMGKSGHIARKIAATFASTGTLSSFVHPGEALHGDLGMISTDDIIIALSNSGGTAELAGIISYANRYNIPLIGITSGKGSALDQGANITLLLPKADEACHVTQAPTTSTLMALAVGDALAVTLMKRRGFTSDDFHRFHPGGKLGAALKKVSDVMRPIKDVYLCNETLHIAKAVDQINQGGVGCVGITAKDGSLTGIITDGDLRRHYSELDKDSLAADVMTTNPISLQADDLAAKGLNILSQKKITSLFVLDGSAKPIGLIHIHDFLEEGVI